MCDKVACPECGKKYKSLGQHWHHSPDHRPSFTDHQREIITGLMMGDGCINKGSNNPILQVNMTSPNYLEHLDEQFGCLATGVKFRTTAAENAKVARDGGLRPNAKAENYSDQYIFRSRSLPELEEFADWYKTGKKMWPEDIELTPTVLKHWYCGDGNWNNSRYKSYIRIGMSNEIDNTDKVDKIFTNAGLPAPSNYDIYERKSGGQIGVAEFTVEQSKQLWEYMGNPLPDFEYKWPEKFH